MDEINISIIIPHYNEPDLLSKLLDTIPDVPGIEVLVVDDHSTEYREAFLKCRQEYSKRNVTFYENASGRKGSGAARNVGIKHARGKYLLFADSDDWFLPGWETAVEEVMDSDADIIFFPMTSQTLDGADSQRHEYHAELVNSYLAHPMREQEIRLRYKYMAPWSRLIKRRIVEVNKIWFDEIRYSTDVMFAAKLGYYARKIQACDRIIYCVVEHDGSMTTFKDEYTVNYRRKVYNKYYWYLVRNLKRKDRKIIYPGLDGVSYWVYCSLLILWYELRNGRIEI